MCSMYTLPGITETQYGCLNTTTCPFSSVSMTFSTCTQTSLGETCSNKCCYTTTVNGLAANQNVGQCTDTSPLANVGTADFLNWEFLGLGRTALACLLAIFAVTIM